MTDLAGASCPPGYDSKTVLFRLLNSHSNAFYALLRIGAGAMFACHGLQKIFGVLDGHQPAFGTQLWFGGVIELTTGLAMAMGLFATHAAFLASGMTAVAYLQFHWKLALDARFFPIVNKGELALVYSLLFLFIASRGAGVASLDAMLARGRGGVTGSDGVSRARGSA